MSNPSDPTNPTPSVTPFIPTQEQSDLIRQYTATVQDNTRAQGDLNTVLGNVKTAMDDISKQAAAAGVSLNGLSSLTEQQLQQLTLLTTGIIKTREAFQGLTGVDFSGISTFSDQIKDLREAFASGGTAASNMGNIIDVLARKLVEAKVPQSAVNEALKQGGLAILNLSDGLLKHADNMLKLQTAYVQMAATTGNLNDIWNASGDSLQNINNLLNTQTQMLGDTIAATGLSAKQVEAYYSELGQIPGALTSVINTSEKGGETTSMLTAAIQTATGTGRSYADVMRDLKTAFTDYGLVGENALRFSTRMSDVSSRLRAPIEDVTRSLRGSADAFKMFATGQENAASSAESLAKTLNTYGKALESTGLSATAAVEVAGNLTNQVSRLSVGQLAFISQRTGGAGGLQGAAQETLKLQTDPGAVVRDAMNTLQQQFGRIVTLREAATSEAAASQNIKQTALLQQLLGPLAKDQATANRLLEAMKNQAEGQPGAIAQELQSTTVQDATSKGIELQKGSYSELTKIRSEIERMRYLADQGAGRTFQTDLAARGTVTSGAQGQIKTNLSEFIRSATQRGGTQVAATAEGLRTGTVADTRGRDAATALHTAVSTIKDVPITLQAIGDSIHDTFASNGQSIIRQQQQDLQDSIAANTTTQRIETAATNAYARPNVSGGGATQGVGTTTTQPVPNAVTANNLNIVGKITIDCPHCGRPHDASNQFKIYSGPAGQAGQ